ncbi:MAG: AsmA family protein [Alphaproteobacteria bacterium]|nr:AsmA family protein [Alphaproteobacteria bacterium]
MNKSISIGFGAFALILTALLLIPRFVDLNSWKPELQAIASDALGRPVAIKGDASLIVLPYPGIILSSVTIGNTPWAKHKEIVAVDEVTVTVSLIPLLTGTLEFSQIGLMQPRIFLEENTHGEKNWDFIEMIIDSPTVVSKKNGDLKIGSWNLASVIPRVNIQKGTLSYTHGSYTSEMSDFHLALKSNSVQGPYALIGGVQLEDTPLEFSINVNEYNKKKPIPVNIEFYWDKQRLQIVGDYEAKTSSLKGKMACKWSQKIPLAFLNASTKDLTITSTIEASKEKLSLQDILIRDQESKYTGHALFLNKTKTYEISLTNLPGETTLTTTGSFKTLSQPHGMIEIKSNDAHNLLKAISLTSDNSPIGKDLELKSQFQTSPDRYDFKDIRLKLDDKEIQGQLSLGETSIVYDFTTPHLRSWISETKMGKAHVKGSLKLADNLNLETDITIGSDKISLQGNLWPTPLNYNLNAEITLSNLTEIIHSFDNSLKFDFGSFKGTAQISGSKEAMKVSQIEGALNISKKETSCTGQLNIDFTPKKPLIEGDLKLGHVNFTNYTLPKAIQKNKTKKEVATTSPESSSGGLLDRFDAQVKLKIAQITKEDQTLKDLEIPFVVDSSRITMEPISGQLNHGSLKGKISYDPTETPNIKADFTCQGYQIHKNQGGTGNIEVVLKTHMDDLDSFLSNLHGSFHFVGKDITLEGFDAAKFEEYARSKNLPEIIRLFRISGKEKMYFQEAKVDSQIKDGIMHLEKIILKSPFLEGNGSGTINLPQDKLDITIAFLFTNIPASPPIVFKIMGSLADPEKEFEWQTLAKFLMQLTLQKK